MAEANNVDDGSAHGSEHHAETGHGHGHKKASLATLAVGAIGVVFGDIGTSPIYAFRETFAGHHPINPDPVHIHGVLSLVFWSMMIVVTFKYAMTIMRADNKGWR
jgi:KUP system potassium uptake protein